jgi:ABC-type cobalamin/Fe3+-siderophores transport system ATPase subunit
VLPPTSGRLQLLGRDLRSHGPRREIRRRLGYLPQNLGYYPGFTVAEFVRTADDPGKAAAVGGPDASSRRWGMAREDMWLLQLGRFGVLAGVVVAAGRDPAITSSPASVWR